MAQKTFVRVFQNRAKFDSRQKFSTWLYAIATNLVKDRYRYRAPGIPETFHWTNDWSMTPPYTPAESLESSERREAVRKAVVSLPEELRLPLILAEYEDRSQAEIGQILGCTAKAVETPHLSGAGYRLREILS